MILYLSVTLFGRDQLANICFCVQAEGAGTSYNTYLISHFFVIFDSALQDCVFFSALQFFEHYL